MYGLVNVGIRELVARVAGEEAWKRVLEVSGVGEGAFVHMKSYDDALTVKLVAAASEVLGKSPSELLEAFGEHWILFTAKGGYGPVLDVCGRSFVEFMLNLESLHGRVTVSFPELRPPVIEVRDVTDTTMRVIYRSTRDGLSPMVVGLLRGLGKRFSVDIEISHEVRREDSGHDEFVVRFQDRQAA